MAKYKYEVYEVVEEYQTFGIESGQIRQISVVRGQVQVYEFNNKNGTYSELSVDSKNTRSYYYKIDNEYFRFTEAVRWIGGSKQYYGAILEKVEVRKEKVKGSLIETIVAEENEYPTNGIKNGKWYVRKEIIQEHKISLKDSEGELINISSIYFKDNKSNILNIAKAYSDKELVWKKRDKELGTLVYYDTGSSKYDISVNGWSKVNPNKNYKFVTTKVDNEYSIIVSGSYYTIKNNDIFRITKNCDIQIKNLNYNYYDIKIYEVEEEANITI